MNNVISNFIPVSYSSSGASLPSPEELKMRDAEDDLTVYSDETSTDESDEEWEDLTVYDDGDEEADTSAEDDTN